MTKDLCTEEDERILNTAIVKDFLSGKELNSLITYFSEKNDFASKNKVLEMKSIALAHAILIPSAMYEFRVTDVLVDFAVECANRKSIRMANALLTAANHYLSELVDGNEEFFLKTEEPMWPHSSFLGIVLAWYKVADCSLKDSGERYRMKGNRIYKERIERYFGDKYESAIKDTNYESVIRRIWLV